MTQQELSYWLALSLSPGIRTQSVRAWLQGAPPPALKISLNDPQILQSLKWAEAPGHHILTLVDPAYPPQLATIGSPPLVLYVDGDPRLLSQAQLAMVGSRYPSAQGEINGAAFAKAIAELGWIITSGMALGIDGICHQQALSVQKPTIAVLGTGVDRPYPREHTRLAAQIRESGALVSEFMLGTPPRAEHFPRRNRIISGLSVGVLVVEATQHSGSLITARCAADQGREVFAIPSSIHNPKARGCHTLLREGAVLVENLEDITRELGAWTTPKIPMIRTPNHSANLDPGQQKLVNSLSDAVTSLDQLVTLTGCSVPQILATIAPLELSGLVKRVGGGYIRIYELTL